MNKILSTIFNIFLRLRYGPEEKPAVKFEKLDMVEYPESGGINTYHKSSKYPFPGFSTQAEVEGLGKWKRLIPLAADFLQKQLKPYIPDDPKKYSKPVREIYRVFNLMIERHHHKDYYVGEHLRKLRDIICVVIEKDDAYRFPIQDAFSELDLSQLKLDERELYWACFKPYDFGGIENKEAMEKIRADRLEYETEKQIEIEDRIQAGREAIYLKNERVGKIVREVWPEIEAVLEKHGVKPNLESQTEEQVDVKMRIKLRHDDTIKA